MPAKTTVTPAEQAIQRGKGIHKWIDDKAASGSEEVLTDATLYYNLSEGEVVMVCEMHYVLETVSDDCVFEIVSCSAVAGGGTPTVLHGHSHSFTGTTNTPETTRERNFSIPLRVAYADGARSITIRINANDSSAVVTCGWAGYTDLSLV